jgi:hypothetical protein
VWAASGRGMVIVAGRSTGSLEGLSTVTSLDKMLKQARDLNQRAAAFHGEMEATHAKDRVGQLYFKIFFVTIIVAGVGLLAAAAGIEAVLPVMFVIVAGCVLVLLILFVIGLGQNISRMVQGSRESRGRNK